MFVQLFGGSVGGLTGTFDVGHGTFDIGHPQEPLSLLSNVKRPMSHVKCTCQTTH